MQGSGGVGSGQGVTVAAPQEQRQCTGTGARQVSSLHWTDFGCAGHPAGEMEISGSFNDVAVISSMSCECAT